MSFFTTPGTTPKGVPMLKQTNLINARATEIDQEMINQIYNIKTKKKPVYQITERKTIFDKQVTKNFKSEAKTNNYYSNYQFFRDYLMTGYTPEFTMGELDKIKTLLGFSKQLRSDLRHHFNMPIDNQASLDNIMEQNEKKSNSGKRLSSIFSTVRYANNFIKFCKLLKLKTPKKITNDNRYQFRLFSQFDKESDIFSIPQFENFINVKYYNQNRKLTKMYHTENMFVDCVKDVKKRLKSRNSMDGVTSLTEIKKSLHVPSVQALFFGRDVEYFKKLDNFVNIYRENYFQIKNKEKDLFNGIYEILTKCNYNCINFLSYLYSKSYMFKYIYDIFTIEAKLNFIDKANVQIIPKESGNEPFLNESTRQLFIESSNPFNLGTPTQGETKTVLEHKEKPVEKRLNNLDNFDPIFGCLFFDKIAFLNEDISDIESDEDFENKLSEVKKLKFDCFMLISREIECLVFKSAFVLPGTRHYYVKDKINKISLFYFPQEEFEDYYNDIDPYKERIFLLKLKKEKIEKIYLFRIKCDSLPQLQEINKEYKLMKKFNDEVFKLNRKDVIQFDSSHDIGNLGKGIDLSKENSDSIGFDGFGPIATKNTNEFRGSNVAVKEDNNVSSSSYLTGKDNLSISKG